MFPEKLVEPVSADAPSGAEAVHSPAFLQLTTLAEYLGAKLECQELERNARRAFQGDNADADEKIALATLDDGRRKLARMEDAVKEVTNRAARLESVRDEVGSRATQFLQETGKDLRAVHALMIAWILERGLEGLEDGLRLMVALLDAFGDQLHPRPDEDDPNDYVAREIVVSEIFSGDAVLWSLREAVLLEVQGVGRFAIRDVDVIEGSVPEDGSGGVRSAADLKRIATIMAEPSGKKPAAELAAISSAIEQCIDLASQVLKRMPPGAAVGDRSIKLLRRTRVLLESAAKELVADSAPAAGGDDEENQAGAQTARTGGAPAAAGAFGPLRTRDDARRQILQISRFLETIEPSNPAPFFLRRAERLLGAPDFFAIMRDMAPNSIGELEHITGHRPSSSET